MGGHFGVLGLACGGCLDHSNAREGARLAGLAVRADAPSAHGQTRILRFAQDDIYSYLGVGINCPTSQVGDVGRPALTMDRPLSSIKFTSTGGNNLQAPGKSPIVRFQFAAVQALPLLIATIHRLRQLDHLPNFPFSLNLLPAQGLAGH